MSNENHILLINKTGSTRASWQGGLGVFAIDCIEAGEHLATFGGELLSYQELVQLPDRFRSLSLQVDDNQYLVSFETDPADCINHSCNPNSGMGSKNTLIAIKAITVGEEVCFDYAMADSSPYDEFECSCGTSLCRGRITGNDWLSLDLWLRYEGYFSPYLNKQIQRLKSTKLLPINN